MSRHTREPWKYEKELSAGCDEWLISMDAGDRGRGICIAETRPGSVASGQENARRIVACVNACRGISTDELEQHGLVSAFGAELMELEKQRDELLAALQGMIDIANDSQGVAGYHLNGEVADWDEFEEWQAACDAIAKTKGGAKNHFPDTAKMVPDGCAVLMTLDEAIDHANEKSIGSSQCAAQHAQLAKWLTDYRAMLAAAPKHEGGAS